ncbi:MAG: lipoprotein signal peptidase [Campylobacter gracilis]|jgi:signal peptidase II|uniref:signal peptidase II n=1 Tax=Campylobacter gracilis TaxID=824 RepID=UPI0026ED34D5|nr:signal peptidase II [Campylobacter gracilis]MBS6153153.1 lipoprotein signal peptidase [Campylobacter gracilis]
MAKTCIKFILLFAVIFAIDQTIKLAFLNGFSWQGEFFSLELTLNRGVAFSMFAFLGENLKFIQIALISALAAYVFCHKKLFCEHWMPFALMLAGGCSNLLDRFIRGGVVDYVAWHKWFEFAVFNFADVMIDLAVVIFIFQGLRTAKKEKNEEK